jgi:hypothetical protein
MKRLNLTIVALLGLCICAGGAWAGNIVGENNWNAGSSFNLQAVPDPGASQTPLNAGYAPAQPPAPANPEMRPVLFPWGVQPVPPPEPGYGGADRKPIRWFMRPNRPSQQGS